MNSCLIIVDVQKDFCPGGALASKEGDKIIPVINNLASQFKFVVASKDWHPAKSVHFENWPVHCVRGTDGATFHQDLEISSISEVALKGTGNSDDGYSAFEATNLDMVYWLHKHKISKVYVCGIATEYCVMATAMDAKRTGFETYVISDAIGAVETHPGDTQKALEGMEAAGIKMVRSGECKVMSDE